MSHFPATKDAMGRAVKPALLVILLGVVVALDPLWQRVNDSRWWRDLTGQTPFRDVEITAVSATRLELRVSGWLTKVHDCTPIGAPIVHVIKDGKVAFAVFSADEPEGTPPSRAASGRPTPFGDWVITSSVPWPDRAVMYRTHDCDGNRQTNEVFDIPWPKGE